MMIKIIIISILSLLIANCNSKPSESLAKEQFESYYKNVEKSDIAKVIHISDFKKTNGVKSINNGVEFYKMEFEAEFKFKECYKKMRRYQWEHVPAGETFILVGELNFEKKENGWDLYTQCCISPSWHLGNKDYSYLPGDCF